MNWTWKTTKFEPEIEKSVEIGFWNEWLENISVVGFLIYTFLYLENVDIINVWILTNFFLLYVCFSSKKEIPKKMFLLMHTKLQKKATDLFSTQYLKLRVKKKPKKTKSIHLSR